MAVAAETGVAVACRPSTGAAVDTLGYLLAVKVMPADEPERAQVKGPAAEAPSL